MKYDLASNLMLFLPVIKVKYINKYRVSFWFYTNGIVSGLPSNVGLGGLSDTIC